MFEFLGLIYYSTHIYIIKYFSLEREREGGNGGGREKEKLSGINFLENPGFSFNFFKKIFPIQKKKNFSI